MQTKIFLGTLLFMIIFAAAGLVLINEGVLPDQELNGTGRMQVETRAQQGRSIEAGALLFFSNCSTCHGPNGEGIPGKGPTLNPKLFTEHFPAIQASKDFNGTLQDFIRLTRSRRAARSDRLGRQPGRLCSTYAYVEPAVWRPAAR